MKKYLSVLITGLVVGALAVLLSVLGNPANMGFCTACFIRDIAGALKLHASDKTQFMRPEILGMIIGACGIALVKKEFRPMGGSAPATRFLLGMTVMIGALVFLGCPLRMVIRLGGGDLNALVGLVGFAAGVLVGVLALNNGFSLKRAYVQSRLEGLLLPIVALVLLIGTVIVPQLFNASAEGPGSMHAPLLIALAAGLLVGVLAQRSRMCMVAGIRDSVMFKDFKMLWGFVAIFVAVLVGNLILGKFKLGFAEQPIAHTDGVWNFLGMAIVGWGSVLLGGCPLRQVVLAGEGSSDSGITVLGFVAGAAVSHNFALASSGTGAGANGPAAVVVCIVILALISVFNRERK